MEIISKPIMTLLSGASNGFNLSLYFHVSQDAVHVNARLYSHHFYFQERFDAFLFYNRFSQILVDKSGNGLMVQIASPADFSIP